MWLIESPWPLLTICLIISAGLFGQWYVQGRSRQLVAASVFLLLGGVFVLVEPLIVTPAKQIRRALYGLAHAFEQGDGSACAEFFSPQDPVDRELVRRTAGAAKIQGKIRITDLSTQVSSAESRATTEFRASATVSFLGHVEHGYTRWELTWQREADEWKIIRVRRLRFMGGGEIEPLSVQE